MRCGIYCINDGVGALGSGDLVSASVQDCRSSIVIVNGYLVELGLDSAGTDFGDPHAGAVQLKAKIGR